MRFFWSQVVKKQSCSGFSAPSSGTFKSHHRGRMLYKPCMWFRTLLPALLVSPIAWISLLLGQLLNLLDWMTTSKDFKLVAEFRITCENLCWISHKRMKTNKQANHWLLLLENCQPTKGLIEFGRWHYW